jgi:hypothetical protein
MNSQSVTSVAADSLPHAVGPTSGGSLDPQGVVEFISFAIGDSQYGVQITAVREIKGWSGVTHLPKQPDYMRGVLNLRGAMVPIIDLRCRFGQGSTEATPMHIVIIVQIDDLLADCWPTACSTSCRSKQTRSSRSRSPRADRRPICSPDLSRLKAA